MTFSVSRRAGRFGALIALAAAALTLTACAGHAPGDLGELQSELATCPDVPLNVYDLVDGTATSQDTTIAREHLRSIEADIQRAAVCGGHVTVAAFGSNSVTAPIYEGDLEAPGSTDIAKLRRVPGMVEDAMAGEIELAPFVTHTMPLDDINTAFELMHEGKSIRSVVHY